MADNTEPTGQGTQDEGANSSPATTGGGTPNAQNNGGGQAAPELKYSDSDMATMRRKLEKLEKDAKDRETAALTEQGKHKELFESEQRAHEATRADMRKLRVQVEAGEMATKVGIRADRIKAALRQIEGGVEYSESGEPTNLEKLLKSVLEEFPEWGAQGGSSNSNSTPQPSGGSTNPPKKHGGALTREAIEKMSSAEINARWPEIQEWMAKNG